MDEGNDGLGRWAVEYGKTMLHFKTCAGSLHLEALDDIIAECEWSIRCGFSKRRCHVMVSKNGCTVVEQFLFQYFASPQVRIFSCTLHPYNVKKLA